MSKPPRNITRNQLAEFLPDSRAIKAFERLLTQVNETIPENTETLTRLVQEAFIDAAIADAKANQAIAALNRIASALEQLALAPQQPTASNVGLDRLAFAPVYPPVTYSFDNLAPPVQMGTIAQQNSDNVKVAGGSINGTSIGATAQSTGKFTTIETAGNAGIGIAPTTNAKSRAGGNSTGGAVQFNYRAQSVAQSDVTSIFIGFSTALSTTASAFTCGTIQQYRAEDCTKGSGSTISNQVGYRCEDLTVGTANYGYQSNVSAGANKWNFYASGTAPNFFNGGVQIGTTTLMSSTVALSNGSAAGVGTLANAPVSGNPTKWIPINDNGTTRYIPTW